MLPETKLDILLARHATLEAELLGQVNSETYVRATRELSELTPVVDAVKAYRSAETEIKDIDALIADPSTDAEMRQLAETERPALEEKRERAGAADSHRAAAEGRDGRAQRRAGNPRWHRRRRGVAVCGRPVPHVRALCRLAGLEGRDDFGERRHRRRIQGNHRRGRGPRRLRETEVRIRRAPGAAGAGHRRIRPHPYVGCDRRGAAGGRGGRRRAEGYRAEDRDHALAGRRRPARQQDRIRRSASRICRPASSFPCRTIARSTATAPRR